jgi:hypothetical protein
MDFHDVSQSAELNPKYSLVKPRVKETIIRPTPHIKQHFVDSVGFDPMQDEVLRGMKLNLSRDQLNSKYT